jgi:protoheme IX farnesyltransferase
MFLWQMPEFYSIAIYRRKEYATAGIPVISVVSGVERTRVQIFLYTFAFVIATLLLTAYGYTGYSYLVVMGLLGVYWLRLTLRGLYLGSRNSDTWARGVFRFSLIILLAFCVMISVGPLLP